MANAEKKRRPPLRFLAVVLVLILLALGVVGALVTLLVSPDRPSAPEAGKNAPPVRQVERGSLLREGRTSGH